MRSCPTQPPDSIISWSKFCIAALFYEYVNFPSWPRARNKASAIPPCLLTLTTVSSPPPLTTILRPLLFPDGFHLWGLPESERETFKCRFTLRSLSSFCPSTHQITQRFFDLFRFRMDSLSKNRQNLRKRRFNTQVSTSVLASMCLKIFHLLVTAPRLYATKSSCEQWFLPHHHENHWVFLLLL